MVRFLRLPEDWRACTILALVFSSTVLVINFTVLVVALKKRQGDSLVVPLHKGSCEDIGRLGKYAHVVINITSTILLGCSNLSMQWLSAPTRADIDSAHSRGSWLDVGVLSVRNLLSFDYKRKLCWLLLCLSSLPLHLV